MSCSIDLSATTPGASTAGACVAPPPSGALDALKPASAFVINNCATCHGLTHGTFQTGFSTPDTGADPNDTNNLKFTYTQLCVRGGRAVGTKIAPGSGHSGGSFSGDSVLTDYLAQYF